MLSNVNIRELLLSLGIKPNLKGYELFEEYFTNFEEYKWLKQCAVYQALADKFNIKATQVERRLRHSVQVAYENKKSRDEINRLLGNTVDAYKVPCLSHFMKGVAFAIKDQS